MSWRSKFLLVAIALGVVVLALSLTWRAPSLTPEGAATQSSVDSGAQVDDEPTIIAAFRDQRSGLDVESEGFVIRTLDDDLERSRHQRFIVRLSSGHTLLVSHNIDLAPRVPIVEGDAVRFRGRYEWNDRGGVIHWTHHDPRARSDGGWIRHDGRLYR